MQYQNPDGSYVYKDIVKYGPSSGSSYDGTSVDVFIPTGATNITIYHLIQGVGIIKIDNTSLTFKKALSGIFTTGAVTFRFDDGYLSQYQNAFPKLNSYGFKGTFFIVSQQLLENGFSGFLNIPQLKEMYAQGHEIGAHTRTHAHLTQLTPSQELDEIQGSRNDLITMGLGPVTSFSYPFGEYDSSTIQIVKNSGFSDAVSVNNGYVMPVSDKFQLERKSILVTTTIDQIKAMIDEV